MYKVREATVLDTLSLAKLGIRYSKEARNHDHYPVDVEEMINNGVASTLNENSCILVCFRDDQPIGLLWGHCHKLPWSKNKLAMDTILYVVPEYRKTKAGYLLMKEWEVWGKSKGAKEVQISIASGIHEEESIQFFIRMGYSLVGSQYRKEC